MKLKILPFLAATMFAFAALGDAVAPADAVRAARGWAREGGVFRGARLGAKGTAPEATSNVAYKNKGGTNLFYAVTLESGALVIVSGDDAIEPVIAFKEKGKANLAENSPLRKILERDIALRMKEATAKTAKTSRAGAGAAAPSRAKRMWSKLLDSADAPAAVSNAAATGRAGAGDIGPNPNIGTEIANQAETIADVRVAPFLTTAWNQEYAEGEDGGIAYCYNYYTPGHYPCGCTATALAQIMKYWGYPDTPLPAFTSEECKRTPVPPEGEEEGFESEPSAATVDGEEVLLQSALYPAARSYDWSLMEDSPTDATSEAARAEIGKLTYDIGLAINSDYTAGATGAIFEDAVAAVHNFFNYANATMFSDYNVEPDSDFGMHRREMRDRAIYANLDAKMPVMLGIANSEGMGGHAVVADGYGFVKFGYDDSAESLLDFAHINVGWGGIDNIWYNLPMVYPLNTGAKAGDTGYKFDLLQDIVFNIHPTETRDILSGRALFNGAPLAGAKVELMQNGATVAETQSGENGIYHFFADGGQSYDVRVTHETAARTYTGTLEGIELAATGAGAESGYTTDLESDVGNSWGNDVELGGSVFVGEESFSDLSDAMRYACTNELGETAVEIRAPAKFSRAVAVTRDISIEIAPDTALGYTADDCVVTVEENAFVTGANGVEWAVQVAAGATLTLPADGIEWRVPDSAAAKPPVFELAGADAANGLAAGRLVVSGKLCLGQVTVHDAASFTVAGAFETTGAGIGINFADGAAEGDAFGVYECSEADVSGAAAGMVNIIAPDALRGGTDGAGNLVWTQGGVTREEDANACFTGADGVKYYCSLDKLFEENTELADVTILRKVPADAWTTPVALAGALKISGKDDAEAALSFGGAQTATAFALSGEDAILEIANLTLTRANTAGKSFITVDGGAKLTLGEGAAITGVAAGNAKSFACAIEAKKGTVEMLDGSSITGCSSVSGALSGTPSAIYLAGDGCVLDMKGGEIAGCTVKKTGSPAGAVRANKGAVVNVYGSATVAGNTGKDGAPANLYIANELDGEKILRAASALSGGLGIGVTYKGTTEEFAALADGVSGDEWPFTNDADATKVAAVSESGATLCWVDAPEAPDTVDADDPRAVAGVGAGTDDTEARYYADVATALEAAEDGETVFLVKDATLERNVEISGEKSITLDGCGFALTRTLAGEGSAAIAVSGAALDVYDIAIDGGGDRELLPSYGRLFSVIDGGELYLGDGAEIYGAHCTREEDVAPVVAWNGGRVWMDSGSAIRDCCNVVSRKTAGALAASAIVATGIADDTYSTVVFTGGTIENCIVNAPTSAENSQAGAVYIANGAEAYVSGDARVWDNYIATPGEEDPVRCNLLVQDKCRLVLDDEFSGRAGYTEGFKGDTEIFGETWAFGDDDALALSAGNFRHDTRRDADGKQVYGRVLKSVETNGDDDAEYRLVWSDIVERDEAEGKTEYSIEVAGLDEDGNATVEEKTFKILESDVEIDVSETIECEPFEIASISRDGDGWEIVLTGGTLGCKYILRTSDALDTPKEEWEVADEITALEEFEGTDDPEGDRAFAFRPEAGDGGRRYWYVEGVNGVK